MNENVCVNCQRSHNGDELLKVLMLYAPSGSPGAMLCSACEWDARKCMSSAFELWNAGLEPATWVKRSREIVL